MQGILQRKLQGKYVRMEVKWRFTLTSLTHELETVSWNMTAKDMQGRDEQWLSG